MGTVAFLTLIFYTLGRVGLYDLQYCMGETYFTSEIDRIF